LENLTRRPTEFNDLLEDWRACGQLGQMAMITASAHPLADLCRTGGIVSPFYNIFSQEYLGLLAREEWQALVSDYLAVSKADLAFIEQVAGGQPFFTQMTAAYLWQAQQTGVINYDQLEHKLKEHMQPHLSDLWRKLTDEERRVLQTLSREEEVGGETRMNNALERRGIIHRDKAFSRLFQTMILNGEL
jgi:hypothetical protein